MKVAVLYWSERSGGDNRRTRVECNDHQGFVRMEVIDAKDAETALDAAKPERDETFLNSVELGQ